MEQIACICRLSDDELENLRRQFGISSSGSLRSMVSLSSAVLDSITMFRVFMGHGQFLTEEW